METNNGYTSTMQRPGALQAPNNMMLVQEEPRGPSQLIEKIVLPDVQQLRSQVGQVIIVKAIRLIPPAVLTNAPTIGGVNAPLTELVKISLVVYCEGWEKAQLIPILTLCDQFIEGSGTPYREKTTRFNNWRNVDWSKSYLQYSNGTPTAGTPYSVLLEVEYIKLDAQGHEIIGPS
jgi:hypothetical protein